ncbi:hypothetical protein IWQ47_000445 [Aquimarina sp. EL_43]|nr:hypothetical protein [Aquimarina sp. EL_32]MBG6167387.1 hypothetical protein [Aquimarina sp. EL_43]
MKTNIKINDYFFAKLCLLFSAASLIAVIMMI